MSIRQYVKPGALLLRRMPAWAAFIEDVLLDKLCEATGHRFCNSGAYRCLYNLVERHVSAEFEVPTGIETLRAFEAWMGWPDFYTDAEDDDDTG